MVVFRHIVKSVLVSSFVDMTPVVVCTECLHFIWLGLVVEENKLDFER